MSSETPVFAFFTFDEVPLDIKQKLAKQKLAIMIVIKKIVKLKNNLNITIHVKSENLHLFNDTKLSNFISRIEDIFIHDFQ